MDNWRVIYGTGPDDPVALDQSLGCVTEKVKADEAVRRAVRVIAGFIVNAEEQAFALAERLDVDPGVARQHDCRHRGFIAGINYLADHLVGDKLPEVREWLRLSKENTDAQE